MLKVEQTAEWEMEWGPSVHFLAINLETYKEFQDLDYKSFSNYPN